MADTADQDSLYLAGLKAPGLDPVDHGPGLRNPRRISEREIDLPIGEVTLRASLALPIGADGFILFAHGSGSSRLSPRNRAVADTLNQYGFGTLLADLLTEEEDRADRLIARLRFDIDFLANRLLAITDWASTAPETRNLPVGYFGASTGAAAALVAAAQRPGLISAIVSRGGRPDLAGTSLPYVTAPTLLIVGGQDFEVIEFNEKALAALCTEKRMEIVPRASHLFEEEGTLHMVCELASDWFLRHLEILHRRQARR